MYAATAGQSLSKVQFSPNSAVVVSIMANVLLHRDDVDFRLTSGYSIIGETSAKYGKVVSGEPEDYEFGKTFWALTNLLINEGKLRTHDVEVRSGGLGRVMLGLADLEAGKIRGHKLVYIL